METLRRTFSRLSLAETNIEISVQQAMAFDSCKTGWLRYKTKYITALNNVNIIRRYAKRFFKWPNRFVILNKDAVHIFRNESKNKTIRTFFLKDVKKIVKCSDTDRYKWCIKMESHISEHPPLLISAPSKAIQEFWYAKLEEYHKEYRHDDENPEVQYQEINDDNLYVDVHLSDEDFVEQIVTFTGHRDELTELFVLCGVRGNYAIRKSRTQAKAVLSVYSGKDLGEYLIIRHENKITINMRVFFDNIKDFIDYYVTHSLPKTENLCLTEAFNTF